MSDSPMSLCNISCRNQTSQRLVFYPEVGWNAVLAHFPPATI